MKHDPKDGPGITYLRHVRGIALDQINSLYDHQVVAELTALYVQRFAALHWPDRPGLSEMAGKIADFSKKAENSNSASKPISVSFVADWCSLPFLRRCGSAF